MTNTFGCKHSDRVQEFFEIESRGVDYVNDFEIYFEFKETWAKKESQMFFRIPRNQLLSSDFIVFFIHDREFYVHKSVRFLRKYKFDNPSKHCCLRYTTIRKNYLAKFTSYRDLKKYIDARENL